MTDITELAQSLKAAAENAIGAHERLAAYPYGEIIDISQHEGEQIDIDITDLNEFNKEANPANILALVEALEKAQGMEAYWKTQCRGITDHCEELQARIAELEREQEHLRPVGVMSEKAFHRLENSECRFIALWPRPGIFLPRKRPEDGVIVYARTAASAGIKVEAE
ncbi:ead/Ea22-like family protein [Klebsiella pneumoniae]|uniref:ead/Ea22-like family protein n=1 Tax=Klebsiella pneumoniae TaxID=573 RepID=UPI001299BE5C|nr:ead/Ea22-like family protein [Klebsiella pneumoniae]MBC4905446.1 ead/Ea22-like family protein [Klebsiella pneumoniae]MBC5242535.1 ead/Ea22-like family protein [Klebsiella pneumoniae]MRE34046.1 ead/Ea22-like family protein [Klebsiella pneumoniae]MRF23530.1 ead/Ea22-like family protein [Klebsiella pneumoniae]